MARIYILSYDRTLDRRALLQAKTLIERGHDVTLYAQACDDSANDPEFVVRVGEASCKRNHMPRAFGWRQKLEAYFPAGLRITLPLLRLLYWLTNGCDPAKLYMALYSEALEQMAPADIIIAHDLPMLPVAAEAVRRLGGKLVYDSHELFSEQEFSCIEKRMWRKLEKRYIARADYVMTVNRSIAEILQQRYALPEVGIVHNAEALPSEALQRSKRFHTFFALPDDATIVLFQGGLSHGRNIDRLVASIAFLPEQVHIVILGSGPMLQPLRKQVQEHGPRARVHFHPAVPQQELLSYTQAADLGVIPYRDTCLNYRYCTPNKLFEFIAAGLPVAATDLPEITRLLAAYDMGLTGDTGTAEGFASLITAALHPDTLARLKEGVMRARQTVNWEHEGAQFARIIEAQL